MLTPCGGQSCASLPARRTTSGKGLEGFWQLLGSSWAHLARWRARGKILPASGARLSPRQQWTRGVGVESLPGREEYKQRWCSCRPGGVCGGDLGGPGCWYGTWAAGPPRRRGAGASGETVWLSPRPIAACNRRWFPEASRNPLAGKASRFLPRRAIQRRSRRNRPISSTQRDQPCWHAARGLNPEAAALW